MSTPSGKRDIIYIEGNIIFLHEKGLTMRKLFAEVFFEDALEIKAYDGFVDNFLVDTTSTFADAFHSYVLNKLKCHL